MQGHNFQYNQLKRRLENGTFTDTGNFKRTGTYKILALQTDGTKLPKFQPYGQK